MVYYGSMSSPSFRFSRFLVLLLAVGFGIGVGAMATIRVQKDTVLTKVIQSLPGADEVTAKTFSQVWDSIHEKHVNTSIDDQKLLQGAIQGMVEAVGDPYTVFFDAESAKSFTNEVDGTFEGVGMEIGIKNDALVVIAPLDGSPAEQAGIRSGDMIVTIDDASTQGFSLEAGVKKIRGADGTTVKLGIVRDKKPLTISVTRKKITIESVKAKTVQKDGKTFAVITISSFAPDTSALFRKAAQSMITASVDGYILDLRGNPGGYLDQAVAVASVIIPDGPIVSEVDRKGDSRELRASGNPLLAGRKIVVLVDEGSASASEIVAGALQDTKRATILGATTYGKGSVQEVQQLPGGAELKITVAKWLTPAKRTIQGQGIVPDIKVSAGKDVTKDLQFDAAIKELLGS